MLNVVTGTLQSTTGIVLWKDSPINALKGKFLEVLGYMPQQQGLYDTFTGYQFLEYFCLLKNVEQRQIKVEVAKASELVNLNSELDKKIHAYSGGMKQRLLAAQSLIGNPQLIIMDEPTAGLDPKERINLRRVLRKEADNHKIIIIVRLLHILNSLHIKNAGIITGGD